jgi:hypothetical protein
VRDSVVASHRRVSTPSFRESAAFGSARGSSSSSSSAEVFWAPSGESERAAALPDQSASAARDKIATQ